MRHLCPDADLRRAKGIPLHPIGSHAHAAEIVLGKRDRRAGKSEVPRLKASLPPLSPRRDTAEPSQGRTAPRSDSSL